jgi:hypothetical protein
MSSDVSAAVRMYRLDELGDCFLITFSADGRKSRMLIDCGSFRNSKQSISRLEKIAADIEREVDGTALDVVVGTHQHNDHLSGFVHCENIFRNIGVEQVWLSWLDNPKDRMAQRIGEKHHNLTKALFDAHKALAQAPLGRKGLRSLEVLQDVLGFYGAKGAAGPPELPAQAVKILKKLGRQDPDYLRPGSIREMPGLRPGRVRIYVLGPPRNDELLNRKDPRAGESYDHALAATVLATNKFLDAVGNHRGGASSEELQYPFSETYKCREKAPPSHALRTMVKRYRERDDAWRTIDDDWLNQAETLALYLDSFTNNSSLALAIELVDSGKVLLFAADAQIGNWLSWPDVKWETAGVRTDDLLARTVLYKVGHHGSHNSTLKEALEKMDHPGLVALIPVHKKDPNITKPNGWKMPARNLFRRLRERTSDRVLQMDGVNPAGCNPDLEPASTAWKQVGIKPKQTDLFIELNISAE